MELIRYRRRKWESGVEQGDVGCGGATWRNRGHGLQRLWLQPVVAVQRGTSGFLAGVKLV